MSIITAPLTDLGSAAAAVVEDLAARREQVFKDGVYFGLPEDAYFADPALGSTSLKQLATNPCAFWFDSPLNPNREDKDTPSKFFGTAMHKCVLEGRAAFEARYAPTQYSGSTRDGKNERAFIEASNKLPISFENWERILMADATVRGNPHLADAFCNGMPEVSIFWTHEVKRPDGLGYASIRKKARIDYLRIKASVDLKTAANEKNIDFRVACRNAISTYRYDIQTEHYNDARRALRSLVAGGDVFGKYDPEWLERVAAVDQWHTVIVFLQSKGAPLVWATAISTQNRMVLDHSRASIDRGVRNYIEWMDRFGPDTPWVLVDELQELAIEDLPGWFARG
jgi:hypothetical protein